MTDKIEENIYLEREEYKALCEEIKEVFTLEKEFKAKEAELRELIIKKTGGIRMEHGILEKEFKAKKAELRELIIKKTGATRMEHGIHVKINSVNGCVDYKI